jgi:LPXTG-motif cell wall-anchored protein
LGNLTKSLVAVVAASVLSLAPVAAQAATPGVGDRSNAVRYAADGPIGTLVSALANQDDGSTTVAAPFPLNFFGTKYDYICFSNNGGVFPTNDSADADCGAFDYDVKGLAGEALAPMVAVLASDTDTRACDATRATINDNGTPDDTDDDIQTLIDDGWGLPCSIYQGTTTVDGAQAFVVTWYRVSQYEEENDPALFNTYQLLLVKRATGSDAAGWDFDFEFNYATLTDDEDGYAVDATTGLYDPEGDDNSCDAYESLVKTATYGLCRWGIGVANYNVIDGATVGYEFFEQYSVAQLIDSGDTAMINHSLGSDVLGRYRCSMINGEARGCDFSAALAETGADNGQLALLGGLAALSLVAGVAVVARRRKA